MAMIAVPLSNGLLTGIAEKLGVARASIDVLFWDRHLSDNIIEGEQQQANAQFVVDSITSYDSGRYDIKKAVDACADQGDILATIKTIPQLIATHPDA